MRRVFSYSVLGITLGLALTLSGLAWAGEHGAKGVKVGEAMPDFTLKDLEGKEHKLSDHKGKTVALVFVNHDCPWVRGAESELNKVVSEYKDKGVVFLGINANAGVTADQIKPYAEKNKLSYPILRDENNSYADAVGATRTPELFIVDKEGKLVYHGAFDDRKAPTELGTTNYVRSALNETLEGKAVTTAEKDAWGCMIKRVAAKKPEAATSAG